MIKLGMVNLNENIYLNPEPRNLPGVAVSEEATMGGNAILTINPIHSGQEIRLVDESDHGAFAGGQIDAIKAYMDAGTEVVLQHHLGRFRVLITAIDVEGTDGFVDPDDDSDYRGEIIMKITEWL